MGYYQNYVTVQQKQVGMRNGASWISWNCFLAGEIIGVIEYHKDAPRYSGDKHYSAYTYDVLDDDRMRFLSYHKTLASAKRALLEPARKAVEELRNRKPAEGMAAALLPDADHQFYPTPSDLAGELLANVDWTMVDTVLEPSAGRGDLLEYAKKRCNHFFMRWRGRELDDVDCVEIDPNLRALLIGKGYRVVHDDFLDFHTRKRYDLILMNPPFAEGDLHLLHALELCEHGGQIACILNAETIRNPYSFTRKALLKELHKHGATIRYIHRAFAHAARRANVDVALINVNIPVANQDSTIWDSLEKAREARLDPDAMYEVAPGNQIERLIREYDLLCESGIAMMRAYNGMVPRLQDSGDGVSSPIITLKVADREYKCCHTEAINRFLTVARSRYWHELFDLPELRQRMTSAMREEYSRTVADMRKYEFSRFNIQQVVDRIMGQIAGGVEEAIVKCFDKLSAEHAYHKDVQNENVHYYNGWKTNKAHYVNMKCIIPTYGCFARHYKPDKYGRYRDVLEDLDVRGCFQTLDDLEKALDYLDKGETSQTDLEYSLKVAAANGKTTVSCKYFTVTFYKKGTCHIKFHDQKIVDRLNIYVGRHRTWLPPSYGSVRYDEMDEESKRVVDEFQGREKYEAICNCPSDYIIDTQASPLLLA